jgi:hypothetical protein
MRTLSTSLQRNQVALELPSNFALLTPARFAPRANFSAPANRDLALPRIPVFERLQRFDAFPRSLANDPFEVAAVTNDQLSSSQPPSAQALEDQAYATKLWNLLYGPNPTYKLNNKVMEVHIPTPNKDTAGIPIGVLKNWK